MLVSLDWGSRMNAVPSSEKLLTINMTDVLICNSFKKRIPDTELSCYVKKVCKSTQGFVYLVHALGTDRYKVGKTGLFTRRCRDLKAQSPYPLDIIHYYWSPDAGSDEEFFHYFFRQARVHGEWFAFHELTEQESEIMLNWDVLGCTHEKITKEMRDKYRWSCNHAIEVFKESDQAKMRIAKKIEFILLDVLCSKVQGATSVLKNRQIFGKDYDLFFCSVLDLVHRSILSCNSINKVAYSCAFLELEIPNIINCLLEQITEQDFELRTKEAINSALSSFLSQIEKVEVIES